MPDDEMFRAMEADYAEADALLLGRRIYEVYAVSWPQRSSDVANADSNNTPSTWLLTTLHSPEWQNSTVIEGDVAEALSRLKQEDGRNIPVNGSASLARSLLRDDLLDELRLLVHPVISCSVKRLKRPREAPWPPRAGAAGGREAWRHAGIIRVWQQIGVGAGARGSQMTPVGDAI